jgi:hypothetical protein
MFVLFIVSTSIHLHANQISKIYIMPTVISYIIGNVWVVLIGGVLLDANVIRHGNNQD